VPRSKKSSEGAILDYFRNGEPGEVKVVHKLATDIVRERFAPSKSVQKRVAAQTRKGKGAPAPQPTEEVTQ
jgi:hypothetical protein